ncbi:MAG: GAF domain-containing sensor histidine kinase [Dehalococcoidales bacterium]|nr:GAF domain-containing sensor histidine kinase [Dehalococcoidales bacterium]
MLERVTAGEAVREIIAILRARTDLSSALLMILERTCSVLGADEAYIMLHEGERLRLLAATGLPARAEPAVTLVLGEGIEGLAAERGETVTVPEASRHAHYRDPFGRAEPVGAMAAVPLLFGGRVTGVIVAARAEPGQFGGSNLWWLDVIGALAGLAIEDDRIQSAGERRARQSAALAAINDAATPGVDKALPRLVRAAAQALGASAADMLLLDRARGDLFSCGLAAGVTDEGPRGLIERLPLASGGPLAEVFHTGRPLLCDDVGSLPDIARLFGDRMVGALLAVAINVGGERRGVLYLADEGQGAFGRDDLSFLEIFAARVGALIEADDLRERQRQLQQAQAEAKARQEFVGVVSHELKTPVAVIQAYTDLLLRRAEKAGGDANTDVFRRIAEQADRMLGLIEQLLDLQRMEAGLFPLEISRFDLTEAARYMLEGLQTTTQQHELVLAADGPVIVSADRRRVEEVLQNLLDNAIRYSSEGGRIEVSVRQVGEGPAGNKAVVAVRDRGQGIPAEEQALIFERFYQGGDHLRRGHVGLGLGLYISREIARRHGGDMWLESAPGKGSTFYFSLPALGPGED